MSLKDLEKLGGQCMTQQYPNPANPKDPHDFIDSTTCLSFTLDRLLGFGFLAEWNFEDTNSRVQLRGIALTFEQYIGPIQLRERPMFWMKAEDVRQKVMQGDWLMLNDIYHFCLLSKIEDEYYRTVPTYTPE
jgi:hypothetical protein